MNKKCKTPVNKLVFAFFSAVLFCGTAQASSKLTIKNDDTAEVNITVEPGDGKLITTDEKSERLILKPGEEKTIEIKKEQFRKETFSVTGKVSMPSLHNSCGPLMIGKDYKVIFVGAKTGGTICISQQL